MIENKKNSCIINCAFFFMAILFFHSCSNIMMPTGGPKDETPPVLLRCKPDNYSLHFNASRIDLYFNEYVVLRDVNKKLLISPPMNEKPEIVNYGKRIRLELKDSLKKNTTYTFNFSDAIADNNEGNPIPEFKYIISTGDYIDSLELSGMIMDAFTNQPVEGVYVGLYQNKNDSAPLKEIPYYVARTDKTGKFTFTNLRLDTFRLFALKDVNMNYKYDSDDEMIGFADSLVTFNLTEIVKTDSISPDSVILNKSFRYSASDFKISLFKELPKKQYLKTIERPLREKLIFVFNLPVTDTPLIRPLYCELKPDWFIPEYIDKKENIIYWMTDTALFNRDTMSVSVTYKTISGLDSFRIVTDTSFVRFRERVQPKKSRRDKDVEIEEKKPALSLLISGKPIETDLTKGVLIETEKPVSKVISSGIHLFQTIDSVEKKLPVRFEKDTNYLREWSLFYKWEENTQYKIMIESGVFTDIYGVTNDTLHTVLKTITLENFGNITLAIKNAPCNILVQLLDEKENVERQIIFSGEDKVSFKNITPKSYKIKAVFDANNNGKWDAGNYLKRIQPERVLYYKENVSVKANWDIELEWNLNEK